MKKATITFITAAALALAIPLYATDYPVKKSDSKQDAGLTQQQTGQMQTSQRITAEELQDMDVVSQNGEKIGEIKKIVIDKQSGDVQYVLFSRGGFLGMGADEIAAPLSAFEIRDDQARLNVDQSKITNVPKPTAQATDSDYLRDLETHYGVAPAWDKGEDLGDNPDYQPMKKDAKKIPENDDQN